MSRSAVSAVALVAEYIGLTQAQQSVPEGADLLTPWWEALSPEERALIEAFQRCARRWEEHALQEHREGRH